MPHLSRRVFGHLLPLCSTMLWTLDGLPGVAAPARDRPWETQTSRLVLTPPAPPDRVALGEQDRVLGVIYDPKAEEVTAAHLQSRLQESGIPYQALDLAQFDSLDDLNAYTFLFLVNLETLSLRQASVLEQWYNRGGRLIVSGPLGTRSPSEVQQVLRNLLGAYWDQGGPMGTQLKPNPTVTWVPRLVVPDLQGGVVVPIRLDSTPVAVWQGSRPQGAAVLASSRSVFLGWTWGDSALNSAEFDRRWLQASLQHFGTFSLSGSGLTPEPNRGSSSRRPDTQAQRLPEPEPLPPLRSPQPANPIVQPAPPQPTSRPPRNPAPAPVVEEPRTDPADQSGLDPAQDPSQQIAKPGLDVELSEEPIIFLEAVAMRQELSNLLGRFQSGHLSLALAQGQGGLAQAEGNPRNGLGVSALALAGSPEAGQTSISSPPVGLGLGDSTETSGLGSGVLAPPVLGRTMSLDRILNTVQNTLKVFPQEVAARNYESARRQWISARRQLWDSYPQSQPIQPEVRAVWLDRGTIVEAGSPEGLARIFDALQASGINLVFFETINAGFPVYPSTVAPEQNPLTQGWDPLAAAVDLAHDRNMELHAWIWTFAVGNKAHNRILGRPLDYMGPVLSRNPDWANVDNRGRRIQVNSGKMFLDPANPEARQYLLDMIAEITDRYDVDGVQLDYIRYPFQDMAGGFTFGYGSAGRRRFQAETGVDPTKLTARSPLWETWLEFKKTQVTEFVGSVADFLHREHPEVALSVSVFPFPTHERNAKIQQDWETWAKAGDVDMVVLMSYAMDTNRFQEITEPWLLDPELQSTLIVPGVNLPQLTEVAVLDQVQFLRDHPAPGYALFAMDHWEPELRDRFQPSPAPTAQVLPHREPFQAARLRFVALETEWDFLRGQEQLWVRPTAVESWQVQRQKLNQALTELARQPSAARLQAARSQLALIQTNLHDWFYLHALEHPYAMQTWEHRLTAIEVLLNYGERAILEQGRDLQADRSPATR